MQPKTIIGIAEQKLLSFSKKGPNSFHVWKVNKNGRDDRRKRIDWQCTPLVFEIFIALLQLKNTKIRDAFLLVEDCHLEMHFDPFFYFYHKLRLKLKIVENSKVAPTTKTTFQLCFLAKKYYPGKHLLMVCIARITMLRWRSKEDEDESPLLHRWSKKRKRLKTAEAASSPSLLVVEPLQRRLTAPSSVVVCSTEEKIPNISY